MTTKIVLVAVLLLTACGTNGPIGGAVAGALDSHCSSPDAGVIFQETTPSSCHSAPPDGGVPLTEYGDTLYNADGYDDDCKYHVMWESSAVRSSDNVTFTVKVFNRLNNTPIGGAAVNAEVFLNPLHPAPNSGVTTVENPTGTYKIGPVRFDASGRWTIRFHMFESCDDFLEDSPHGHAAFYVDVP